MYIPIDLILKKCLTSSDQKHFFYVPKASKWPQKSFSVWKGHMKKKISSTQKSGTSTLPDSIYQKIQEPKKAKLGIVQPVDCKINYQCTLVTNFQLTLTEISYHIFLYQQTQEKMTNKTHKWHNIKLNPNTTKYNVDIYRRFWEVNFAVVTE